MAGGEMICQTKQIMEPSRFGEGVGAASGLSGLRPCERAAFLPLRAQEAARGFRKPGFPEAVDGLSSWARAFRQAGFLKTAFSKQAVLRIMYSVLSVGFFLPCPTTGRTRIMRQLRRSGRASEHCEQALSGYSPENRKKRSPLSKRASF